MGKHWVLSDVHEHGPGFQSIVVFEDKNYAILWCGYDSRFYLAYTEKVKDDEDFDWCDPREDLDGFDTFAHAWAHLEAEWAKT